MIHKDAKSFVLGRNKNASSSLQQLFTWKQRFFHVCVPLSSHDRAGVDPRGKNTDSAEITLTTQTQTKGCFYVCDVTYQSAGEWRIWSSCVLCAAIPCTTRATEMVTSENTQSKECDITSNLEVGQRVVSVLLSHINEKTAQWKHISVPQSKNAVSTNTNHSRYIQLMSNFSTIHFHTKKVVCTYMFDIVDTPFIYGRGLIVCSSLHEFSKTKESTLHVIWNVDTVFLVCGTDLVKMAEVNWRNHWWFAFFLLDDTDSNKTMLKMLKKTVLHGTMTLYEDNKDKLCRPK